MSRQINLFSTAFRRQRKPFSATWIVAGFVTTVALATAYYAVVAQPLQAMRAQRVDAAAQVKTVRDTLVAAGKEVQKTSNKALEDQVARAEAQLKGRQELVGRLQTGEIGNRDGYSKYLLALARQHLDGVWLTNIDISGPSDEFSVRGRTQRASQVSDYIKMLKNEEGFRGKPISTLSLVEREIEVANEQGGVAAQLPGTRTPQGASAPAARPKVLALEFVIGTGAPAATEGAGK